MIEPRPQIDMPRFDATPDGQTSRMADARSQLPAWNRERLIRQFQQIDGSTRSEAERQIDAYERSFSTAPGGPATMGVARGGAMD